MRTKNKMDKTRARQLYELADRLSRVDVSALSEEQLSEREQMISRLKEELSKTKQEPVVEEQEEAVEETVEQEDPAIAEMAYERLYRVFDFSGFKG